MAASANCSLENFPPRPGVSLPPHVASRESWCGRPSRRRRPPAVLESPHERRLAVVPLAGRERDVPRLARALPAGAARGQVRFTSSHVRPVISMARLGTQTAPLSNRSSSCSGSCSRGRQAVEVRRLDVPVAQRRSCPPAGRRRTGTGRWAAEALAAAAQAVRRASAPAPPPPRRSPVARIFRGRMGRVYSLTPAPNAANA